VATYSVVQDEGDQQLLYIMFWDVEVLGDEGNPDARVGLHNIEHHLCANVLQQIFNVVSNERIIIDCAPAVIGRYCHHLFHRRLHHSNVHFGWK